MEEFTAFEEILKWEVTEDNQNATNTDENSDSRSVTEDSNQHKLDEGKITTTSQKENGPSDSYMLKTKIQNGNMERGGNVEDAEEEKLKDSIKIIEETGLEALKGFDATIKKEVIQESQDMTNINHSIDSVTNKGDNKSIEENGEEIVTVDSPNPKSSVTNIGDASAKGVKEEKQAKKKRKHKARKQMHDDDDEMQNKYHLCRICKISFRKEKRLLKHMKKYHTESATSKDDNSGEIENESNRVEEILKLSSNLSDDIDALLGANMVEEEEQEEAPPSKRAKYDDDLGYSETGGTVEENHDKPVKKTTKTRKPKKVYICKVCNMTFPKKKLLKVHATEHEEKKTPEKEEEAVVTPEELICKMCYTSFTDRVEYIKHSEEHRKEMDPMLKRKIFPCDICGATFTKKWNVKKHLLIHSGGKKYECDICESKFASSSAKTAHMVIHSGKRPFKCNLCKAAFNQKGDLSKHMKIHTGEKPFKCYYCEASFNKSTHMKKHIMLHTGEKPFKCEICNIKFIRESSYKTHQQVHLGAKPYKCDLCGATFVLRLSYNMHMKRQIHNGDSQYKCKYCDLELTSEARYNNHIKKHEEPSKKHKCDLCHAEFVMKCSLIRHKKIHTGERPFQCEVCDARFAQKFSLTVHQRLHEGDMPFKCEICDAAYVTKSNYTSHMKLHSLPLDESPLEDYQMSMMNLANMTSMSSDSLDFIKKMAAEHMAKALEGTEFEGEGTGFAGSEEEESQASNPVDGKEIEANDHGEDVTEEGVDFKNDIIIKKEVDEFPSENEETTNGLSDDEGENGNEQNIKRDFYKHKADNILDNSECQYSMGDSRRIDNDNNDPTVVKTEVNDNESNDSVGNYPNGMEAVVVKVEKEYDVE